MPPTLFIRMVRLRDERVEWMVEVKVSWEDGVGW